MLLSVYIKERFVHNVHYILGNLRCRVPDKSICTFSFCHNPGYQTSGKLDKLFCFRNNYIGTEATVHR